MRTRCPEEGTPVGGFASKNNHSQRARVAPAGVFPYNTAPLSPGPLAGHANRASQDFQSQKDNPLMSTVEQQVKAIVAEQLGVKQE